MNNYHQPAAGPYDFHHLRDGTEDLLVLTTQEDEPGNVHGVATCGFWNDCSPDANGKREATFRLLAAAPELRDALAGLCHAYERMTLHGEPYDLGHMVVDAKLLLTRVNATTEQCGFVLPTHFKREPVTSDSVETIHF